MGLARLGAVTMGGMTEIGHLGETEEFQGKLLFTKQLMEIVKSIAVLWTKGTLCWEENKLFILKS